MYFVPVTWTSFNDDGVGEDAVCALDTAGGVEVLAAVTGAVELLATVEVASVRAATDWILNKLARKATIMRTLAAENAMVVVFIPSWY
jgi:hypothetical protein